MCWIFFCRIFSISWEFVVPENIHTHPIEGLWNSEGYRDLKEVNFQRGGVFFPVGFKWDGMNTNLLSQSIQVTKPTEMFSCWNKRKILCHIFTIFVPMSMTQIGLLSSMFVGCQVKQNAKKKGAAIPVRWSWWYVVHLYFEDCAVWNAADAFPSIIHAVKWDSCSVYLIWYSYKIIPISDLL